MVVIARFLHVADLGYDLTVQIQAAQQLLQGHGISFRKTVVDAITGAFLLRLLGAAETKR